MAQAVTERAVTFIPATMDIYRNCVSGVIAKRRVAGYARVSTDQEEQLHSYEAQIEHYTEYISSREDWEFVAVYTDEGISATSTAKREGFKKMVVDALDGKIDLIVTKSISRFARNTVDTLITIRELKSKGIEVYFEKENIYTLDSKGELMITIMSSLAQEEARSISENVTWGQRIRMKDGKVSLPYGRFLGYEKGEDGFPKIVESEAKTVRLIYTLFLQGKTISAIARHLTSERIPTPATKEIWSVSTVSSILQNEKYKGDALLQKAFTVDFLTKKTQKNNGEIPQYYVQNSHPAIIEPEMHDLVQEEMKKRKATGQKQSGLNAYSGIIICGECGSYYGPKTWHSNSKYKRTIWRCNNKYNGGDKCRTPHLSETDIQAAFVNAFNQLYSGRDRLAEDYATIVETLADTSALDKEAAAQQIERDVAIGLIRELIEENARTALDQKEYGLKHRALVARCESANNRLDEISEKKQSRAAKRVSILRFISDLDKCGGPLAGFDEQLWNETVDTVTVHSDGDVAVAFKDGSVVDINLIVQNEDSVSKCTKT
jgi:DNA invertase Pin-like site-specific DNA recombinase